MHASDDAADTSFFYSPITRAKGFFFAAAGISFLVSVFLWFSGDHERGMFVGLWVPSICSAGALMLVGVRDDD